MAGATTIDELQVLITASSKEFAKQIEDVKGYISNLAKHAEKSTPRISAAAVAAGNIIAKVFTAAFRAVANSMDEAISRLDTLNNFPKVMSNLGISTEESKKAIDYLTEKLQGLPTTIDSAALAVQRFTSANGNIGASTQMFLALNNAILAGGASMEIQKSALEQVSQAYAKNKPDMMEWRTMMMAMPAQLKQIANAMGYATSNDLGEALRDGTVSMNEFMSTIAKLNREGANGFASFEDQARNATGGVQTSIINMKTALVRGLQQIMDAIGQSNIAGFFNMVAKAIGTAANYVIAFIRLVLTAINAIRALFGKSAISFGATASSASGAASAVSGIGDAADDATDAIGGTGKAAKKLQQQLAGFDEMNVLKEPDSGSSGGGNSGASGAGGGVGDIGDFGNPWEGLEDSASKAEEQIEAIMAKIRSTFENIFSGIDFEGIILALKNAFIRLWDDIKGAFSSVSPIFSDLWGYLKEVLNWTGTSLIPSILNAIGGALQFLGAVLGELWSSYLKPFVDDFLVPIARWTGGAIVKTLNGIGDGLRNIAKNEKSVKKVTDALVAFGTAIAGIKITKIVSALKTAITVFTSASKAGLTLSSAFGAVAGESTGLISVLAGKLSSGIGVVSTLFKSLWGVISAHPIAALITVIASLLLTNENFRQSISNLLQAVMGLIGSALKPLFEAFQMVSTALQPLYDIIGSLLTIIIDAVGGILAAVLDILAAIFKVLSPFIEIITSLLIVLNPVMILLQALAPLLQLLAEALQWLADLITGVINGALGWLTDLLGLNSDALDENAKKAEADKNELSELEKQIDKNSDGEVTYGETIEWVNGLLAARANKELAVIHAEQSQEKKLQELTAVCEEYGLTLEEANAIVDEGTNVHGLNESALRDVKEAVWESRKADLELEQAQSDLQEQTRQNDEALEHLYGQYDELVDSLEEFADGSQHTEQEFEDQKQKIKETREEIKRLGGETEHLRDYESTAYHFGQCVAEGAAQGVEQNKWRYVASVQSMAISGNNAFQAANQIHSPSRVFKRFGKFIGEGAIEGVNSMARPFAQTMADFAAIGTDAIDEVSTDFNKLSNTSQLRREVENIITAENKTELTINIGGEKLVDTIIGGINDRNFLQNGNVLSY